MELFLNLAGVCVALAMVCLWLRMTISAQGGKTGLGVQLVALALLILILFPVISVTDDLLAAENPAETDSIQRRDHAVSSLQAAVSQIACCAVPFVAVIPASTWSRFVPQALQASLPAAPFLGSIENRPPPTV